MKYSFSLLLLAGALLSGCTSSEIFPAEEQANARAQATAVLTTQKNLQLGGATLKLLQIEDSRCPMNANCIRQGSAIAHVQLLEINGSASVTKQLYLGDALEAPDNRGPRAADTVEVGLSGKNYQIILSEVQPYPNTSDPNPAEKTAKLSLRTL
ncbi:hypothetical protein [Rufibacter sp. LB8]|uniref:hypothetical protein n=1 Tax=Rufibacter sp. LB8 TaxID=2777781 RepID=UPI00178C38E6|nr:hypothetical protein [Rufibacter sp. LB8]